jgi:hypothetical protein
VRKLQRHEVGGGKFDILTTPHDAWPDVNRRTDTYRVMTWDHRGLGAVAVTADAAMYQCAEIIKIARGRGMLAPNVRHASVYRLRAIAFIGVP